MNSDMKTRNFEKQGESDKNWDLTKMRASKQNKKVETINFGHSEIENQIAFFTIGFSLGSCQMPKEKNNRFNYELLKAKLKTSSC